MGEIQAKTTRGKLTLELHGATCRLESDYAPFAAYARAYLADLVVEDGPVPDVVSCLHWDALPPDEWREGRVLQHGRRLWQSGNSVLQLELAELPGLQIEAGWSDGVLVVDAYYRPASKIGRLAQRLNVARQRAFAILVYYLAYFPVIYHLSRARGMHVLHAGSVWRPEGGWIIAGLPGSGKTTFTLSLLSDPHTRLLSDNLLLFDGERVYACPEPLHLSAASRGALPDGVEGRLVDARRDYSHGRRDFRLSATDRAWQARPGALFFLGLGSRLDLRAISPEDALERLLDYDRLAKEIDAYEQFAAALDLAGPGGGRNRGRVRALEGLVSRLNSSELWLQRGADVSRAFQLVLEGMKVREGKHEDQRRVDAAPG